MEDNSNIDANSAQNPKEKSTIDSFATKDPYDIEDKSNTSTDNNSPFKKKLSVPVLAGIGALFIFIAIGASWLFLRDSNADVPANSTETTTTESAQPTESRQVPIFSVNGSVQYFDSETQETTELYSLGNGQVPLTAFQTESGVELYLLEGEFDNFFDAYTDIVKIDSSGESSTVYSDSSAGISVRQNAFDSNDNTLFTEEYYTTDDFTGYNTNIISIDLDDGTRTELFQEAAFAEDRGPVFPVAYLEGGLVLGETSCYECDGPRLSTTYRLDDGQLTKLAEPAVGNNQKLGGIFYQSNSDYIISYATTVNRGGLGQTTEKDVANQEIKLQRINNDLSVSDISYSPADEKDTLISVNGSNTANSSYLGVVYTARGTGEQVLANDNDKDEEDAETTEVVDFTYSTFASLSRDGSLSPIQVNSRVLDDSAVVFTHRDENGLFYIVSSGQAEASEYSAYYLPLNDEDSNDLIEVDLQSNTEYQEQFPRLISLPILEIEIQ